MFIRVLAKPLKVSNFVIDKSLYGLLLEIDECSEPPGTFCDVNAYCIDTEFSYQCSCKEGYSGDGFSGNCKEIGKSLIKNGTTLYITFKYQPEKIFIGEVDCRFACRH